MKKDRELLELAAKAAGVELEVTLHQGGGVSFGAERSFKPSSGIGGGIDVRGWNPLEDDGDALRLVVSLKMRVWTDGTGVVAEAPVLPTAYELAINNGGDIYAATRRAIVRAAAAIGEKMP